MIYPFKLDDVAYEADVTVTPSIPGGIGDPPEGTEIELHSIWLVVGHKRVAEIKRGSGEYEALEANLFEHDQYILDMAKLEAIAAEADEADARNDREREG